MENLIPVGKNAKQLLSAGIQSTRQQIPLGAKANDGDKIYRWAYVKASLVKPGMGVCAPSVKSNLALTTSNFKSLDTGYGLTVGDVRIRLYGVSGLTDLEKYVGGTLMIKSTGGGAGYSYTINAYEAGRAGNHVLHLEGGGLAKALSRGGTVGALIPNEYHSMTVQSTVGVLSKDKVVKGITVVSGGSGYMLIQTKGIGPGYCMEAQSKGRFLGIGTSGRMSGASTTLLRVAQAAELTIADGYCAVDILIEK